MTAGTSACGDAFRHELVVHRGMAELLDVMVPFVREGAATNETVLVVGETDFVETLLSAVGPVEDLRVVEEAGRPRHPGRDLRRFQQVLPELEEGDGYVRVVNQMPPIRPSEWREWRRYEAAVNTVLAPYRVRGTCAYDVADAPDEVLDELFVTHPYIRGAGAVEANERFSALEERVGEFLRDGEDLLESRRPDLELADPSAAAARAALRELTVPVDLTSSQLQELLLAATETVTNAWRHGRPPVRLRVWSDPARVRVAVTDAGPGPHPLVGLLPPERHGDSGRGVWLLHQLMDEVHHHQHDDGYTIQFVLDAPRA